MGGKVGKDSRRKRGICSDPDGPYAEHHSFQLIGEVKSNGSVRSDSRIKLFGCDCGRLSFRNGKRGEALILFHNGLGEKAVRAYAEIVRSMTVGDVVVHINRTGQRLGFGRDFTL